ncbi:L-fucose dehydrogenase [plant metagenome]|uniref:L-fucose dehydrogenase n=1 Tax=plant metagenome TaxID=1297885 RepID=A0A484Q5H4_9ZZZZ
MTTRRRFLTSAAIGAAALAAAPLVAQAQLRPGDVVPTRGTPGSRSLPTNATSSGRWRPQAVTGFGGAPIGNHFAAASEADAQGALEAAWNAGARVFDTSPWYGLGLSERRFGHFLSQQPRDSYVLSTKIGRLLTASRNPKKTGWIDASPFDYRYDYSAEGTRRSVEDSLQRLGVSHLDIVLVHDLSEDNGDIGARWPEYFEQARTGAFVELTRMREEGLIKAWGMGVNTPEPALRAVEVADPDIFLLACQYSLLDHERALAQTFPRLAERGISVIVGSPLLAGYMTGRDRYLYGPYWTLPGGMAAKRARANEIAAKHGVDIRTAALQFAAVPEVVSVVAPGARNAAQARANVESMTVSIPAEFWVDLRREGIISADAPVPD